MIQSLPAIARIGLVLAAVLILLRLRLHIGLALVGGSLMITELFDLPWRAYPAAVWEGFASSETLFLVCLVVSIVLLSNAMNQFGQIRRLIDHFRGLVGESRILLVAFPAMIGLLPMPGGAIFSAPMVDEASRASSISASGKTIINYWFRHIWEFWWPLYPGMIVAMALTGVDPGRFILRAMPMSIVALLAGYWIILRGVRLEGRRALNLTPGNLWRFGVEMIPILLVIASLVVLGPLAERFSAAWRIDSLMLSRAPILIGVAASLGWVTRVNGATWRQLGALALRRDVWSMALLVAGLMIFKQVLDAAGAIEALKRDMLAYHIPLPVMVAILPFIAGLVVGIAVGYVGVSFPIVLSLLAGSGIKGPALLPYVFLAYSWGYSGMMASPVHLCLLLTRDYFHGRLMTVYKDLSLLVGTCLAASALLFWFYV
ncbi:MAG: DUF401 family protein [bacterium]|nr:DUF401 family protein [bacterium]